MTSLPHWLQVAAEWNPLSAVVAAARRLFGNQAAAAPSGVWTLQHPVPAALLLTALMLAVFVPLALRRYDRQAG